MKKALLISFGIFFILTGYSQVEKGKMFIGGNVSLNGGTYSNPQTQYDYKSSGNDFSVNVSPGMGFFISSHFAIGPDIQLGYSHETSTYEYNSVTYEKETTKTNTFTGGVGFFARYYKKIIDNFYFMVDGRLGDAMDATTQELSNGNPNYIYTEENPATQKIRANTFSFAANPGCVYFVTPKLGIQATFGSLFFTYSSSKNKSVPGSNQDFSSNYGVNLTLSTLNFGVNYYF